MSEIGAEQFTELRAYIEVLGLDQGWRQAAAVCRQIEKTTYEVNGVNAEVGPLKSYIPDLLNFEKVGEENAKPGEAQSQDDMRNAAAARYGF